MKLVVSVFGRFHAFYLAEQLQRRNHLKALITSYPKFEVRRYGIDDARVRSLVMLEALRRMRSRAPSRLATHLLSDVGLIERFDRRVASLLTPDIDVFIGWSGGSLHSIRRAHQLGIPTVLVRGSTHIQFQSEILQEEYTRWGIGLQATDARMIERELMEYEETDFIYNQREFVRQTFLARGVPAQKLFVVHPGVDTVAFTPGEKTDRVFRVIFCGSLSLRKGLPYLLHAFCELDLSNSELWLIGSATPETTSLLRQYSSPRMLLKGAVRQSELKNLYAQGSALCCPSIEEGLAMVQAQGMACGLPLVCTDHAGGEVFVREGMEGFVIPIRDVDAIKAGLLHLYENPDLAREMGRRARRRMVDAFTWDHYGSGMASACERIVKAGLPVMQNEERSR